MTKKLSEHLKISEGRLSALGVFDPVMGVDTQFFIDPKSLEETSAPEFQKSKEKMSKRYSQIFTLVKESQYKGDKLWRTAFNHFPKGEFKEICIGHGFDNTEGRGAGPKLVNETLETVKEFISVGIDDPEILELIGLFQKGIGTDIVSDMTAQMLADEIVSYTTRITAVLSKETEVKPNEYSYNGTEQMAFNNPYNHTRLLLLPEDILQPIIVAHDWSSIDLVCQQNQKVRDNFAKMLGVYDWKRATAAKVHKNALKNAALANPEAVKDLLRMYKDKPAHHKYDFVHDPSGEYLWYERANEITSAQPLTITRQPKTPEDVDAIVEKMIANFKRAVENNGCWTSLYSRNKDKKVLHESYAQKLFYCIADSYCESNNLDISPETNGGQGPVDFKFSNGAKAKVLVEIKLSSSSHLQHGFTTQVAKYEEAERPYNSHYLVIDVTAPNTHMDALNKAIGEAQKENKRTPKVQYVNGKIRDSASKA